MSCQNKNTKTMLKTGATHKYKYCKDKCEKRNMIGSSWWKVLGYNSPCNCAKKELLDDFLKKYPKCNKKQLDKFINNIVEFRDRLFIHKYIYLYNKQWLCCYMEEDDESIIKDYLKKSYNYKTRSYYKIDKLTRAEILGHIHTHNTIKIKINEFYNNYLNNNEY